MTYKNVCIHQVTNSVDPTVVTGYAGLNKGERVAISGLMDEFVKNPKNGLFVSDFDNCITRDDFGVQCFEGKLHNGEYWKFTPEQFSELLLPTEKINGNEVSYADLLQYAILPKEETLLDDSIRIKSAKLSGLHKKLVSLYALIQKEPLAPRRMEFHDKMIEFDQIVLSLEGYFSEFFGNQIFSRLRFFAGRAHTDAKTLAGDSIREGKLQINADLMSVYNHLKQSGAKGKIITTNFLSFVREAVNKTTLGDTFEEDDVLATKMKGTRSNAANPLQLNHLIENEPVFGTRKAQLARQQVIKTQRKLIMAAGDSHMGDGPMLAEAIRAGGVSIVPVSKNQDIEKIAYNIEKRICQTLGVNTLSPEQQERVWYLQTNNFVDARK